MCDKKSFDSAKSDYEKTLKESGYKENLKYDPTETTHKTKIRKRDIIWYTPPYSAFLKTRIGREVLKILDKNVPKNNPLNKILNRKTVKVCYSCTANIENIMKAHNNKILSQPQQAQPSKNNKCNCRNKNNCPIRGMQHSMGDL